MLHRRCLSKPWTPLQTRSASTRKYLDYQGRLRRPANLDPEAQAARKKALEEKAARWRIWPLSFAVLTAGGLGLYLSLLFSSTTRESDQTIPGPKTQNELTEVYDRTAKSFDTDVNFSERLMGVIKVRKGLAGQCRGHVLEVSCGTARNLGYYKFGAEDGVKSLTLADLSLQMVEQGRLKWFALRDSGKLKGEVGKVPVRFWKGDVKGEMPPPPADIDTGKTPSGYDTIIQSMGLCSTDEPVQLLKNLSAYLNTSNPDARILLLEHGRSYFEWWNGVLDNQAAMHASKHGCWWNRDIGDIVKQSGLEVVRERRNNFGTTWIFELRPVDKPKQEPKPGLESPEAGGGGGWGDWLPRWTYEKICKR
ncbi:Methyltransferase OMS1-like protein [Elsinoe fawcettii]|nr:Methyltransferase OMS1-like protein [Elsinoe fawcettii]